MGAVNEKPSGKMSGRKGPLLAVVFAMVMAVALCSVPTAAAAETSDGDAAALDSGLPLRAAAASDEPAEKAVPAEPGTFTIAGMKYLEGRPLQAGEFSFKMALAGAAAVPAGSDLPAQLRGNQLSDREKYELVAYGSLVYYPASSQPAPASPVVVNAADGTVAFGPLTFDPSALGSTATARHRGVVFCYTIAEQAPVDAEGNLLPGVTRDPAGRYVYKGVTYDDAVKRAYLYAYETADETGAPVIEVMGLGDATFAGNPERSASGLGRGFNNIFKGAYLDNYDGLVYLEGKPIEAGAFRFDVREVAEDGALLDDQRVACAATAGGEAGAGVPVIDDALFGEPGRFFYAVTQTAPTRAATDVVLDEASYVVTVEVTENAAGTLEAAVTHVRKKPADSDLWVDVPLDAQPSPLLWENRVKATEPGGDTPGEGGTDKPEQGGDTPGADVEKPGGATDSTNPGTGSGTGTGSAGNTSADKPQSGTGASTGNSASKQPGTTQKSPASENRVFAQTGDDLGVPMLIAFLVVVASGAALALLGRRRTK